MLLDGHGSRLQREVARVLAKHHVYCVLEPANSSTDNQALDNGDMAAFNNQYRSLYTMCINLNQRVSVEVNEGVPLEGLFSENFMWAANSGKSSAGIFFLARL
jgi:hypothetical protein